MAEKKKLTATQRWAKKKKKATTSKDVPGDGLAKSAAKTIEEAKRKRQRYLDSI